MSQFKSSTNAPINPQLRKSAEPNAALPLKNTQQPAKQTANAPRPFSPPAEKKSSAPIQANPVRIFLLI